VIVVGIGSSAPASTLDKLASYPSRTYAIQFSSFTELVVSAPYISSVISNVPRLLSVGTDLSVPTTVFGVYYTVQLNTYDYITINDTLVTFTTNCNTCAVYASLSEPNPTNVNAISNTNRQYFRAPGYTYSVYYFRIPTHGSRFFLSFLGSGISSITGTFNVFSIPPTMSLT
jgi:hypothetical protein